MPMSNQDNNEMNTGTLVTVIIGIFVAVLLVFYFVDKF